MRVFVQLLRLELRLQARSFLFPATAVSTAMICAFVMLLPARPLSARATAFFVFMDPATIGLSFVGAMVLKEKAQGTLFALGVTPIKPAAYVAAKTVSLSLLTFSSSLIVVQVATGGSFDLLRQLIALALCSTVAVLLGLLIVARVASMNELVVTLLWVTTLLYIPLLTHFSVLPDTLTPFVAAIPSYAMLTVLATSVDPVSVSAYAQIYAVLYLAAWVWIGWRRALRELERAIITEGR